MNPPPRIRLALEVPVDEVWLQLEALSRSAPPDEIVRTLAAAIRSSVRARVARRLGVRGAGVVCSVDVTESA